MQEEQIEKRFVVKGRVQGVFFRKTFTGKLENLGLLGGATNCKQDRGQVFCTVIGKQDKVEEFLRDIKKKGAFNHFGAEIKEIHEVSHSIEWQDHDYVAN